MKNKLMLVATLPLMACVITSCNNRSKSVNFKEALDLVVNRYDEHALDYVKCDYVENTNKFYANLNGNITNTVGTSYPFEINLNIPSIKTVLNDLYAITLDSSMFKTFESMYNSVAKITLDQITNFKLNKEYLIANNCLTAKVGTEDNLLSWIALAANALNVDIVRKNIPIPYVDMVFEMFMVTIDPLSQCDGKCYLSASTDDCGFISNVTFIMNGYIDLNINLVGKSEAMAGLSYFVNLVGDIDINVTLDAAFNG